MRSWSIALFLSVPVFAQEARGVVTGAVRNSVTGAPLDGVSVELASQAPIKPAIARKQTSSAAGTFNFDDLPSGSYQLRFRKSGYVDSSYDGGPVIETRVKVDGEADRVD